ncbi:hypothetical protein R3P38DRAFT_2519578 [Favolaschia claudopus]|uniref:CCHC-type domain-containing protein n=1 Tax=Favolaschia claudopus TaxID=2862362 RepID=A0AAW0C7L0_9AGAR
MAADNNKMFYGDGRAGDYNPHDYIKMIKRGFITRANVSEANKVELFSLSLAASSEAGAWFDGLGANEKATWAALEAEFLKQWPKEAPVVKSAQDLAEEMMKLEMHEDDLGKKLDVDGISTYEHVQWARRMRPLCVKDTTGLLIPQVRKKLPRAVRNLIQGTFTDWTVFLQAIRDISVTDLEDEIEKEKRLRSHDAALQSPTAPLRAAMAKATLATPSATRTYTPSGPTIRRIPAPANFDPFASTGPMHPANIFAPGRARPNFPPSTPSLQVPVAQRLATMERNLPPHHPNTGAGQAAYAQQVVEYKSKYGDNPSPNEFRPYPLTPGTQPLDAGACYDCGHRGHVAKDRQGNPTCPTPQALPELERRWRSIAGYIYRLGRPNNPPVDVRYVATSSGFYDRDTDSYFVYEYDDEQGKGQGSSE